MKYFLCIKQDQQEINITDEQFASKMKNFWTKNHQLSSKSKAKLKVPAQTLSLEVGQLFYLKQEITKHTARQLYIVTSDIKDNLVLIKKILYFHSDKPGKFLNIEHTVKASDLIPITSKPKEVHNDINTWQEIWKIMNPCSKRKTKSLSLKEILKLTYTYDTSEDESEEEDKKEIDNTPNTETVTNNELEDPVPDLDMANIPDTNEELGNNMPDPKDVQLTDNVLGAFPRQRIQRKAAIKSRNKTRQLALQDEGDPDLMEQIRNHPRDLTPVPSREPSLDQSEDDSQLQDSPTSFSYKADHTMVFGGGNPTYLGQLYDVTLGSPLLMALTPSPIVQDSPSQRNVSPIYPDTLLDNSSSSDLDCVFKYPKRIFYLSKKSRNSSHQDSSSP